MHSTGRYLAAYRSVMPEDFSGTPSLTSRLTARFCVLVRMVRMRTPAAAGSMVLLQSTATRSLALRSASAVLVSSQNRAISLRPTWLQCQHQKHRSLQQEGSKLRLSSTSPSPDDPSLEVSEIAYTGLCVSATLRHTCSPHRLTLSAALVLVVPTQSVSPACLRRLSEVVTAR